jgi:ketosteroid isomerase-like protein
MGREQLQFAFMEGTQMTTQEVAKQLVDLCSQGKFLEATKTLYSPDIVSVEAMAPPGGSRELSGIDAVLGKANWWQENHEVHSASVEGPVATDHYFCVRFKLDVTNKPSGMRMAMDELALYHVKDGKIVREEFFYQM